jgi:hypothetical protein
MATSQTKLLLFCDADRGKYTLQFEGADWSESFDSTNEAIHHAEAMVKDSTPMTVCDFTGRALITVTVTPPSCVPGIG